MRKYPQIFSQNDPRWAPIRLGTAVGATIGLYGCLIISYEMKANYYGHQLTPPQLNNLFIQNNLYTNGDYVSSDDALSKVFPDIIYLQTLHFELIPADLDLLKKLSADDEITVTLCLDYDHNPSDGIQTHYVELKYYNSPEDFVIYDPWDGKEVQFSNRYGSDPKTTIQKYIVYKGSIPAEAKDLDTIPILLSDWKRVLSKSYSLDVVASFYNLSDEEKSDPKAGEKILAKIKTNDEQLQIVRNQLTSVSLELEHIKHIPVNQPQPVQIPSTPPQEAPQTAQTPQSLPIQPDLTEAQRRKNLLIRLLEALFT